MIDELKELEVDWSMERTIAAIDKAIAAVKSGKDGEGLYKVITQKVGETENYYDRPLDSTDTYKELAAIASKFNDSKMEKHATLQINIFKANDLEFQGRQQTFYGNNKRAVQLFKEALDLYPDHELAASGLDKSQKRVEKSTMALDKLEEKADKDPSNKKLLELGKAYCDLGMLEKGKACFERMMKNDPEDPDGPARVGMALCGMGKHRESLEYFEKAMVIKPKMQHAKRGKTWALYELGELFEMPDEE